MLIRSVLSVSVLPARPAYRLQSQYMRGVATSIQYQYPTWPFPQHSFVSNWLSENDSLKRLQRGNLACLNVYWLNATPLSTLFLPTPFRAVGSFLPLPPQPDPTLPAFPSPGDAVQRPVDPLHPTPATPRPEAGGKEQRRVEPEWNKLVERIEKNYLTETIKGYMDKIRTILSLHYFKII